jgi:hypothetical protein
MATTKLTLEERNVILATLEGEQAQAVRELCDDTREHIAKVLLIMGCSGGDAQR